MGRRLESTLKIDNEGVIDPLKNILFTFNMFNLFKLNNLTLLEAFES